MPFEVHEIKEFMHLLNTEWTTVEFGSGITKNIIEQTFTTYDMI